MPRVLHFVRALALLAAISTTAALPLACACARGAAPSGAAPTDVATPPEAAALADGAAAPREPCSAAEATAPRWWDEAVGYEIFVRSFQDSDGDGVGDLTGLTQRLDSLNDGDPGTTDDLGVDLLWLMPITESPSYHGYDVTEYRTVDAEYGTAEDLQVFLDAAHARGLRVVTDLVMNHSSKQHPWFLDAATGPDAAHRDWYVWSDTFLDWDRPWGAGPTWHRATSGWYYALFWEGMPDLDYRSPAVQAEMAAVALHWLELGVDGFRLDAARYLVETGPGDGQADTEPTHACWRGMAATVAAAHPDALLVGEVWTDSAIVGTYFGPQPSTVQVAAEGLPGDALEWLGLLGGPGAARASADAALSVELPGYGFAALTPGGAW